VFELVWVGPYQYRDHLLERFRHGRVFFIGDAAHVVSPFGARGGNSGIQDAANLGWKLALVLEGRAGDALLDTYDSERHAAAVENLQVTSRTARFLAPRSPAERALRNAALGLAREYPFGRTLVNTGRMSVANPYPASPAVTNGGFSVQNVPVQLGDGRWTNLVALVREAGTAFIGIVFAPADKLASWRALEAEYPLRVHACGHGGLADGEGKLAAVLGARPGSFALIRPDLYLAGIAHDAVPDAARAMLERALCSPRIGVHA
jgi:3-(3-hydroxy-phenyl)propionate hydroxylase